MKNQVYLKFLSIKNLLLVTSLLLLISGSVSFSQQITGLSGWNIYVDPGHSQNENVGIYGYSEAKKNLRVGLNLRQMLLDWTDIDTVYICRTNDQQLVSLTQRTDEANALGADWYHSIHSDAAAMGSSANSTLLLWGQYSNGLEKVPNGGKAMSDIMIGLLTAGMRTYTVRGSVGDCTFYGCTGSGPYLHVNRETNMPSELSEAGFHTNPRQNQLNMNDKWKRLEAKTMFWTILEYHNIQRPFVGTIAGIINDLESGIAINGAIVSIDGQTDTTDTWESLFHLYSSDPNLLRNGFYYFENIPPGTHTLQVTADGFEPFNVDVTMQDTFFTFKDVEMISTTPPVVTSTEPQPNDSLYPGVDDLIINFSRPMDKASVESNILFNPNASVSYSWSNSDKTLSISTDNFNFNTNYEITISGNALDKYGHQFDGNGDGTGGDPYTFNIKTRVQDTQAPFVVDNYPAANAVNVELRPVINMAFNEVLNTSTISGKFKVIRNSTQTNASGILRHYSVNGRSALNYFITTPLIETETYTIQILPGIEDIYGNPIQTGSSFEFTTGSSNYNTTLSIDDFESGIAAWFQPGSSPTTVGILPDFTSAVSTSAVTNLNTASTKSMQLNYGWDTNASSWLIREYKSVPSGSFDINTLLQAFLFGDGSGNQFRFAVKEASPGNYEVSPWYNVDWIGWRLVTWDLSQGQTGNWVGNGILEPPLGFDSFQFTFVPGNQNIGTYYLDDVRLASFGTSSVEQIPGSTPVTYNLDQNYPNPFNPSTRIKFSLPEPSNVKLIVFDILGREVATLVNDNLTTGSYSVKFDASSISSGVYFYMLITDNYKQSRKMILMK